MCGLDLAQQFTGIAANSACIDLYDLDLAFWVDDKGAVVVGVIVRPEAGGAIVLPASGEGRLMPIMARIGNDLAESNVGTGAPGVSAVTILER
mgnify:CR=1 FL=1